MKARQGQLRPLEGLWLAAAVVFLVASVGAVDKDKSYTSKLLVLRRFDHCRGERQHLATRDGSTPSQLRCAVFARLDVCWWNSCPGRDLFARLMHGNAGQIFKQT